MVIAHQTFHWENYLDARTTAEQAFRAFYQGQGYAEANEQQAVHDFIFSFFNACIDEHQFTWMNNHPNEEYRAPSQSRKRMS